MKKLSMVVAMLLVAIMLLTACAPVQAPTAQDQAAEEPKKTVPESTEPKAEEPSNDQIVVGFCNIAETAELHSVVKKSMEEAAAAKGYELIYMNNKLDGQVAVSNADAMLLRGIDAFIEFNVDVSIAPVIMEKMNDAGVPVVAVDIAHPGAIYFGANNYGVGPIVGEYLGNICKKEWGEPDCLLIVEDAMSGVTVLARTDNVIDGFKKVFPDFADDKVYKIDGGADTTDSQEVVANFLSAHPDFNKIAVAPAHVTMTLGALAAIETAGRQTDCLLVSQGEYDYLEYLRNNPEEPEWEVFRGTLVYNFKNYGTYCMDIVEKLLAGETVAEECFPDHFIIDRTNAAKFYPEAFN